MPVPVSSTPSSSGPVCEQAIDYPIQRGDTLWDLATRLMQNGTQGSREDIMREILAMNPRIKNPDRIYAGDTIQLPGEPAAKGPARPQQPQPQRTTASQQPRTSQVGSQGVQQPSAPPSPPESNHVKAFSPTAAERTEARSEVNSIEARAYDAIKLMPKDSKANITLRVEADTGAVNAKQEAAVEVERLADGTFAIELKDSGEFGVKAEMVGAKFGLERGTKFHVLTAEGAADLIDTLARHAVVGDDPSWLKEQGLKLVDEHLATNFLAPSLREKYAKVQGHVSQRSGAVSAALQVGIVGKANGAVGVLQEELRGKAGVRVDFEKNQLVVSRELSASGLGILAVKVNDALGMGGEARVRLAGRLEERVTLTPDQMKDLKAGRLTEEEARKAGKVETKVVVEGEGAATAKISILGGGHKVKVKVELDADDFARDRLAAVLNAPMTVEVKTLVKPPPAETSTPGTAPVRVSAEVVYEQSELKVTATAAQVARALTEHAEQDQAQRALESARASAAMSR